MIMLRKTYIKTVSILVCESLCFDVISFVLDMGSLSECIGFQRSFKKTTINVNIPDVIVITV